MQRVRRSRLVNVVLTVAVGAILSIPWLAACSNYEEGERCEILNGNEDCLDGLACTPKALINTPFNSSDRCCPVNRSTASHPACTLLQNPITGDAAPATETGPGTDSSLPDTGAVDASDAAEGG